MGATSYYMVQKLCLRTEGRPTVVACDDLLFGVGNHVSLEPRHLHSFEATT